MYLIKTLSLLTFLILSSDLFASNKLLMSDDSVKKPKERMHVFYGTNLNLRDGIYDLNENNPYSTINTSKYSETIIYAPKINYKKLILSKPISIGIVSKNKNHIFIFSTKLFSQKHGDLYSYGYYPYSGQDAYYSENPITRYLYYIFKQVPNSIFSHLEFDYLHKINSKKIKLLYLKSILKYKNFYFDSSNFHDFQGSKSGHGYSGGEKTLIKESKGSLGLGIQKCWRVGGENGFGIISLAFNPSLNFAKYNYNKYYFSAYGNSDYFILRKYENKTFIDFNLCLSYYFISSKHF